MLFLLYLQIGDWGLGIGDWAQSPIPNPQSPCIFTMSYKISSYYLLKLYFLLYLMSKPINEYSNSSDLLNETLLSNVIRNKQIKAQILTNDEKLIDCSVSLGNKFEITAYNDLNIKIDYLDILGFIQESINDPQSIKRSVDVIKIQERDDKTIGMLNFFPNDLITTFSFSSIFCCKFYKTEYERRFKVTIRNLEYRVIAS
jgi:hypothetical protein